MKTERPKERESDILKTCMEGLAAKRIFRIRINAGKMFGSHKGKKWAVVMGPKGIADILAIPIGAYPAHGSGFIPLHNPTWIEIKTATGKQSPDQAQFEREVTAEGHRYLIVRSWDELLEKL